MNGSGVVGSRERTRVLNAVLLQNAVLRACDVVKDSPPDACMVCGRYSLFNLAPLFGGKLPEERASLVAQKQSRHRHARPCVAFPEATPRPKKSNGGIKTTCSCRP
jgi:hypothetical protein